MEVKHSTFLRDFWQLLKGYWNSEEKWRARFLLGVVVLLNLGSVYILVVINEWYNTFYNALQNYDIDAFMPLIGRFTGWAFLYVAIGVYGLYLNQMLQIRWRKWMTKRYLDKWLQMQTYYKMQVLSDGTDNPDQRISEDINQFVSLTLDLSLGLLKRVTTLIAFVVILWNLSGVLTLPVGGTEIKIYGYMVWLSLAYAIAGTYLTHRIGKPLIGINFNQQRFEADFRFQMARLRENSETVALYRGEAAEQEGFWKQFMKVFGNYRLLMTYGKRLSWFTNSYGQLAIIFPILLACPRYFAREMQIGGLMQVMNSFSNVQESLSYFIDRYSSLAQWASTVKRLAGFTENMEHVEALPPQIAIAASGEEIVLRDLTLRLPNGQTLLGKLDLQFGVGERWLIAGPSGSGKSTLLRAVAGLWPFGGGCITLPAGQTRLFVPQRPYLPIGTLRAALFYPAPPSPGDDEKVREILRLCHLADLVDSLDIEDDWPRILSLGEQQRVAFARILLTCPAWVFLDESTSALDEPTERDLYHLIAEKLPAASVISIGHRSTLQAYHHRTLLLTGDGGWRVETLGHSANA